jgi:ATP-binding cassette subfamily F protein 3
MMFEGDAALKKIKVLSGGERARVMLGKILAREHNLLLLDEPTNHLDLESIESLTDEIINFEGAVVMVTHSELMLKNIANKLIIFQHNNAIFFDGNYEEFLEKIGWESEENKVTTSSKDGQKNVRELRARLITERSKIINPIKEKIEQLESEILKNEDLVKRISDQLIRPEVMNDASKLSDFTHAIGKLNQQIEESFDMLTKENDELIKWNEHFDFKQKSLED